MSGAEHNNGPMGERGGPWCILRMSPGRTLAVAEALAELGFEVWTPSETIVKRVGLVRKQVTLAAPLLPTFVFARAGQLGDLLVLARSPALTSQVWDSEQQRMITKGCPHFTVFRHGGRYPLVSDRSLDTLRVAEQRGRPMKEVKLFSAGERVKCPDAGFDGLVGVVETTKGRHALVCFEGFAIPISIPTQSLLSAA
jgi:hypothetical protein